MAKIDKRVKKKDCWEITYTLTDRATGEHLIKVKNQKLALFVKETFPLLRKKIR